MKLSLPVVGSASLVAGGAVVLSLGGASCRPSSAPPSSSKTGNGPDIRIHELAPDALFSPKAQLSFPSYIVPVSMRRKEAKGVVTFELLASGSVIQVERYSSDATTFGLIEMSMETYKPALPLLMTPNKIGGAWKWSGSQESGGITRKSWAEITTELSRIPETGLETVHATVSLFVDSSAGAPSKRKIDFWFAKGKGIVKCSYGDAITRTSLTAEE